MSCVCQHCGAKMKKYKFSLNRPLVDVLVLMRKLAPVGSPIEINSLNMTTSQWTNFQKLRYWNLIARYEDKAHPKGGIWVVTQQGADFVDGTLPIRKYAVMYRNELVEYSGDLVFEKQIKQRTFKTRPEYAQDHDSITKELNDVAK